MGLVSCEKCGPFPDRYKIIDMEWSMYNLIFSDSMEQDFVLDQIVNDSVDYNSYCIMMFPITETYFTSNQFNSFSLITSAYACSPVIPTSDEKIDSIQIITNRDFDETHPAGSNLADIFDVIIDDPQNNIYNERHHLQYYTDTKPFVTNRIILLLNSPPTQTEEYVFTIKYYQDGVKFDYFDFTANSVVIRN